MLTDKHCIFLKIITYIDTNATKTPLRNSFWEFLIVEVIETQIKSFLRIINLKRSCIDFGIYWRFNEKK